ncbi:MAG: ASKHA domain-containing protein [Opitutaceae bacterium]|nr:ASKHA domain-containing protein [Opitutaceae bacterium]
MNPEDIRIRWPDHAPDLLLPAAPLSAGNLAERVAQAGRPLNTRCGQHGLCAGCTVKLVRGTFRQLDGTDVTAPCEVKACQGYVPPGTQAVVAVPARSLAVHRPQVVTTFKVNVPAAHQPLVHVEPGRRDHGLAIDIGTTTVVVALVELTTGNIVREETAFNQQIELGDNVLTRIQLAGAPGQLEVLRRAIVSRTLVPLIGAACAAAGVASERLAGAVVAGNTTMLHLLTGTDPTSMGVAPFRPVFTQHRVLTASALQLTGAPPAMPVHLLPGFSAYVGADLVAGCVCTGLLNDPGPSLLVDIGTNGEILLRHGGRLMATATAAGPAFEGGRLACGTRAVAGAIAHVSFPEDCFPPRLDVIPNGAHVAGLCGSAYIDFLAHGRQIALLGPSGRIAAAAWAALPPAHRHSAGPQSGDGRGVRLRADDPATLVTEADIAQLLQAKAAVATGMLMLLRRAGIAAAEVRRLYLAGGFGLHLDVANAIACGLLPGFRPEQVDVVGNTALGGAWLALVDRTILPEMTAVGAAAEIVELNRESSFEDTFIDQLALP